MRIKKWLSRYLFLFIFPLIALVAGLCITYVLIESHRKYENIEKDKRYNFRVVEFHQYRGVLFLNDSIAIGPSYDDKRPPSRYLNRMIEKGDSIVKNKNSDTIYLYKGIKVYWFIRHFNK